MQVTAIIPPFSSFIRSLQDIFKCLTKALYDIVRYFKDYLLEKTMHLSNGRWYPPKRCIQNLLSVADIGKLEQSIQYSILFEFHKCSVLISLRIMFRFSKCATKTALKLLTWENRRISVSNLHIRETAIVKWHLN